MIFWMKIIFFLSRNKKTVIKNLNNNFWTVYFVVGGWFLPFASPIIQWPWYYHTYWDFSFTFNNNTFWNNSVVLFARKISFYPKIINVIKIYINFDLFIYCFREGNGNIIHVISYILSQGFILSLAVKFVFFYDFFFPCKKKYVTVFFQAVYYAADNCGPLSGLIRLFYSHCFSLLLSQVLFLAQIFFFQQK